MEEAKTKMEARNDVLQKLKKMEITYELEEHPAVYTIEEMEVLGIHERGDIVKNLFLRDANGKRHFLVVLSKDKRADLKAIRSQLDCSALSFASEPRLARYLKLSKGAVSPLGLLNDADKSVEAVFDRDLIGKKRLGVHPNENTSTVWLSYDALKKIIESNGNAMHVITLQ